MSHSRILTFLGSQPGAGACERLMSNPSSWVVDGRLEASSMSQTLEQTDVSKTTVANLRP